jgi:hypothetical protein
MNPTTLAALADFPDLLEANFAAVPIGLVHWRPDSWEGIPSERLTAIEQICHVRDIEIDGYHVRFRRTLIEDRPVLPDLDGESLAEERKYSQAVAADVLAGFKTARAATIRTISELTEQQLDRVASSRAGRQRSADSCTTCAVTITSILRGCSGCEDGPRKRGVGASQAERKSDEPRI